jgi:hypothetical protein
MREYIINPLFAFVTIDSHMLTIRVNISLLPVMAEEMLLHVGYLPAPPTLVFISLVEGVAVCMPAHELVLSHGK